MFQLPSPGYVKPPPKSLPFSSTSAGSGVGCMALRWWGKTEEHLILELQSQMVGGPGLLHGLAGFSFAPYISLVATGLLVEFVTVT